MSGTDRPPTILVVDDDALIRMAAVGLVEDLGFTALEVDSADAALLLLAAHDDIRVVFTDIQMPGSLDGLELAAQVRERWPAIDLIIVSGQPGAARRPMPLGARFLAKPYCPDAVSAALLTLVTAPTTGAA